MNFRQVEVFKALMEAGTVTGAAQRLGISQPAASKLIAELEHALGFQAFGRIKGRLVPTPDARILYEQVDRAFISLDYLSRFVRDLRDIRQGRLVVGCLPVLAHRWMPSVVARFLQIYPQVTISLQPRPSRDIREWVTSRKIDLGVAHLPGGDPDVKQRRLMRMPAVCVCPPSHRFAGLDVVRPGDLDGEAFVSLSLLDQSRHDIDRVMEDCGVRRVVRVDTGTSHAICALVAEGVGVGIVDSISAADCRHLPLIARPFRPPFYFDIMLLEPLNQPRSRLSSLFVEHLKRCSQANWIGEEPSCQPMFATESAAAK